MRRDTWLQLGVHESEQLGVIESEVVAVIAKNVLSVCVGELSLRGERVDFEGRQRVDFGGWDS